MKTLILRYLSITFLMAIFFTSCDDIVTYDDEFTDETASNGPPVITRISTIENQDNDTTQGSFNQMIVIH